MKKLRVVRHEVVQPPDPSIKLIPLTQGHNAIVDAADYEFLMQWNWALQKRRNGQLYAYRKQRDRTVTMHQVLTNFEGQNTDHVNGNGLDNRRSNLRSCTISQNQHNQRPRQQFKGITPHRSGWQAQICLQRHRIYLGTFNSPEEASRAYDAAARKYFGEFARLNFP